VRDRPGRESQRSEARSLRRPAFPGLTFATIEGMSTLTAPAEVEVREPSIEEDWLEERPWVVIVWNDPINLMSYVTLVFQKLFGYSLQQATKLMLQVHNDGKAVVSSGNREKSELDVSRLHAHGLWATMQQD
jgi:ATP-dependent Clp protease adaptor protein ClpS